MKKAGGKRPQPRRTAPRRRAPRLPHQDRPSDQSLDAVRRALRAVMPSLRTRTVRPGSRLVADLGVDSLKVAELSIALEEAADRPVFLGDLFATVADPTQLTVAEVAAWLDREEQK